MFPISVTLVVSFLAVLNSECGAWDAPSTVGREFVFAVPSDYVYRQQRSQRMFLSSQTGQAVEATIVTGGSNFRHVVTVPADQEQMVDLPRSLTSRGTGLKQSTVGVRADGDISIHVQIDAGVNSGAFTPIPTSSLGRDYIIGIYEPLLPSYRSGFIVTAAERGAMLSIDFTDVFEYGHVFYGRDRAFRIHLEPYESFQVMTDKDMTGTRVRSDHPIAVVAGSECSRVPRGVKYCDYLVEQVPPVHTLGKEFVVAPFKKRRSSFVLRIVAPFNDTLVQFPSSSRRELRLEENQFHEIVFSRQATLSIRSSEPVLVLQFMKGFRSGDYVGDPAMVVIPPVEQYVTGNLTVVSMDGDHVTIVVANTNETTSGLRLDGGAIPMSSRDWGVISDDVAGVIHGTLSSGRHLFSHTDPEAKMLVIGYGHDYLSSRAFPVSFNLKRLYVPSEKPLLLPPRGYYVKCLNTSMIVTLDASVFLISHPEDVSLNDHDCQGNISRAFDHGIIVIQTDFDSCGTEVEEYGNAVTFLNTMWFAESAITPISPLRDLPFKCVIEQRPGIIAPSSLNGGQDPAVPADLTGDIMGDLTVSLIHYVDDMFAQPLAGVNATTGELWGDIVEGTQGQNFFAVNVTSSVDASVFVDSCWTTPSPDQADSNSKDIIQNGCGIDDTIRIGASVDDPRFRPIAVDAFSPIGEYHEVYMHCRVQVCRGADPSADCLQECPPRYRKRRNSRQTTRRREYHTISTGPIRTA